MPAWLRFNDYAIYLKSQNFKRILLYISSWCYTISILLFISKSGSTAYFINHCMNYIKYCRRRKLDMVKYRRNNKKISNEMIWYTRRDDLQILVEEEAERNIHFAWGMMCFKHAIFPFACHNALCMCVSLALEIIMIAAD